MVAVGIGKDILREKPLKLGDLSVKETDELKMVSVLLPSPLKSL